MAAFLTPILGIIDRVIPDKAANDAAKAALLQSQVTGELQESLAQIQVNATEAASATGTKSAFTAFFVAGWRPAVGWLCGLGLLWEYFLAPLLGFFFPGRAIPSIPTSDLDTLLFALLGMGAMRTVDKIKGVGSGH